MFCFFHLIIPSADKMHARPSGPLSSQCFLTITAQSTEEQQQRAWKLFLEGILLYGRLSGSPRRDFCLLKIPFSL